MAFKPEFVLGVVTQGPMHLPHKFSITHVTLLFIIIISERRSCRSYRISGFLMYRLLQISWSEFDLEKKLFLNEISLVNYLSQMFYARTCVDDILLFSPVGRPPIFDFCN